MERIKDMEIEERVRNRRGAVVRGSDVNREQPISESSLNLELTVESTNVTFLL
jgi:hypothetical protein